MPPDFQVMGVVNVTPDSFSDGGRHAESGAAIAHARRLVAEGATIVDIGGESTRPGAFAVDVATELERVLPVVEALSGLGLEAQISIDTAKLPVAEAAIDAGAGLVNDVTALRGQPELAALIADRGVDCCLMHMRGTPRTMQRDPRYGDVVDEVRAFLEERLGFAVAAGIAEHHILLDPGIGFGKTAAHNLELLRRLDEIAAIGRPLVFGSSRKSFLGLLTGRGVDDRVAATVATNVLAYERGASIFRVHDVAPVHDALTVTAATVRGEWTPRTTTTS